MSGDRIAMTATGYFRLAREGGSPFRWWAALVVGVVTVIGAVLVQLSLTPLIRASLGSVPEELRDVVSSSLGFAATAAMLPILLLARRIFGPRPVGLISSVAGRFRWGWFACAASIAVIPYLATNGGPALLDSAAKDLPPVAGWTVAAIVGSALLIVPLQAAAEEYVFRGYLGQLVGTWLRKPIFAVLLPVPVFVASHGSGVWGYLALAVLAVSAAWLTWRTGGLEAAVAIHAANNSTLFVLAGLGLVNPYESGGPSDFLLATVAAAVSATVITLLFTKFSRTGAISMYRS